MALTINAKAYALDSQSSANAVVYAGPLKTFGVKDDCVLARTFPKPTATYAGKSRTEAKLTRTLTLADGKKDDAIFSLSTSVPVGAATADVEAMLDDLAAWLATAAASDLVQKLKVNQ